MSRFSFNLDSYSRKQKYAMGKFDAWIHSKFVLYVLLASSIFQLFVLANSGKFVAAISFIIVASIIFYFISKNMVIVLVSAFAISSIVGIIPGYTINEGMEDGSDDKKPEDEEGDAGKKKDKKSDLKDTKEDSKIIAELKKDGESLIKTQEIIMNNFKKISPELDKVESLVDSMNKTAQTLSSPEIKEKLKGSLLK